LLNLTIPAAIHRLTDGGRIRCTTAATTETVTTTRAEFTSIITGLMTWFGQHYGMISDPAMRSVTETVAHAVWIKGEVLMISMITAQAGFRRRLTVATNHAS